MTWGGMPLSPTGCVWSQQAHSAIHVGVLPHPAASVLQSPSWAGMSLLAPSKKHLAWCPLHNLNNGLPGRQSHLLTHQFHCWTHCQHPEKGNIFFPALCLHWVSTEQDMAILSCVYEGFCFTTHRPESTKLNIPLMFELTVTLKKEISHVCGVIRRQTKCSMAF